MLGLLGIALAYAALYGFQKIPFTCSYLPGKSQWQMIPLTAGMLLLIMGRGVAYEAQALENPRAYVKVIAALALAAALARWRSAAFANSEQAIVRFEEQESSAVLQLGLFRDGIMPLDTGSSAR